MPVSGHPPRHIAIIMDGNGRWAKKRGKPRLMGHQAGVRAVQETVAGARELGVEVLTLYAFSTENWRRPGPEVESLMGLLENYLQNQLDQLLTHGVRLRTCGTIEALPPRVQRVLAEAAERTAANQGLILNLALSYGSRDEIVRASRRLAAEVAAGRLPIDAINEETIAGYLDTAELPDPDLLIRTGGETRLSNFLLWQLSYSELYFTEILWPDFGRPQLLAAINDYQQRQRRFGHTSEQLDPDGGGVGNG
ncbi:MAG: isoprenyl transferase [Desulfurivibrio sp.]|nr:isoprenyl transferase [Desulfurivibrio sp.]